ncbi:acetolactate synthase-1/2/3 large subunit [Litoreibacter halocynthiae]|uniref:Acetolactate synthase-1/2/3 large subunit n=1 Tax=Litoreibacter halocynthiae TaxID=1242689 RepID=A0A4R7LN63_9RHOB|nr:thiamine pyrophosphate-binding protein [Litoreibacter halocynthiae]TDT77473.1 acetolactate synthase-1/2/3 large subunit [Litoreibacter halocynthiae]
MGSPKRAADLLAERLFEAGCRHAFGMPGGEVLTLVDALEKAGIEFVLCKHENAAGFMAEGVHHVNGAPAILVATVGPGAMNGVNVVANAHQERVPMIVLTGCVDPDEALTYTHQVLDHRRVFDEITKATFTLTVEGADIVADKAVGIATEGRGGPVHIDVPISVADAVAAPKLRRRAPAGRTAPVGDDLALARAWLDGAERPVIIAGLDVLYDDSAAELLRFAEVLGAPVITTYKAKGVIPETHPLALGGAGLSPLADTHLLPLVRQADLVICVGYDPIEMRPGWREVWDPDQVRVIDISAAPNHHYMHQAGLSFVCDTGAALRALTTSGAVRDTWPEGEVAATKSALAAAFPTDEAWGPAAIIATCRDTLPEDAIATVDSGAHRILLSQMWTCQSPRTLLQSSALCTMGCAVPLAMGAKYADPARCVVSFSGDAGALMVAGEWSTAKEHGLNTIFVVFVDRSLSLIELKQRQRQMGNAGVDFDAHDFAAIGRAFGGEGHTVTSRAQLQDALTAAMQAETFTVIAALIDRKAYDGRI